MRNFTLIIFLLFISIPVFAQDILMQNGTFNQCSGTLYDSGGPSANYSSDENFVLTICPDGPDQFIQLDFTTFGTQGGSDILTIYDGDDTTAPVIGSFDGGGVTSDPGTIMASITSATGCLTLEFVSNATGNTIGWAADIDCFTDCQTITPSIDSTNPAVNGTGVVQVLVGTTVDFTGSAVFSEDGTGATYNWNFGDGSPFGTGEMVSNQFDTIGTYTTTLTVTDTNPLGCSETATVTVQVLGPYIDVDQTTYTVPQLVEDVLINSPCATVSNINWSTGTNFGDVNGIGYFSALPGAFGFDAGIVLNSGDAMEAEGPESGIQSSGGGAWPGDADLEAEINTDLDNTPGDDLPAGNSRNASFIEFDFVPLADTITFNFLFASDEYGAFQCSFSDAFAFLLTDLSTNTTTNLALVPGTTDVVSVFTVRDNAFAGGCSSENPTYFDSYHGAGGEPAANAPIDYLGYTVPMAAIANVTPNNNYRIKLVVADARDTSYNSAVFLEAGSFSLGGDLGDDITINAGTAECQGTPVVLDTQLPTATHTWYLDGVVIPGETNSTLNATQDGEYTVDITFSATCMASDSIIIEFIPGPTIQAVNTITECDDGSGAVVFDLTENDAPAFGAQDQTANSLSYHNSNADAMNGVNPIGDPVNYNGTDGEIIYIRIEDNTGTCADIDMFTLEYLTVALNDAPDIVVCDDLSNDGQEEFDLTNQDAAVLGAQAASDFIVTYHSSIADADTGANPLTSPYTSSGEIIYVRIESVASSVCYISSQNDAEGFTITINPIAEAAQPSNLELCDDSSNDGVEIFDLTTEEVVILNGQDPANYTVSYYEQPGDVATSTNAIATPGAYPNMSSPQTIYVRVDDNSNPACFGETSFTITVNPEDDSTFTMQPTCDGATVDTVATPGGTYVLNPDPADGSVIDATTGTITDGLSGASYTVDYTTNGTCPSTSSFTVTVDITNDASFTMNATCDGGIVTSEATPGGTYAFNPIPTDAASIDPVTGTVTGATSATVYMVEYSLGGACPSSTIETLTVLTTDDATVTYTPTCDGAVVDSEATPGGSYAFNTVPTDGAILDTTTGAITGGTPGASYTVDYTTNGSCPATSTTTVTANPLPTVVTPTPLEVCDDATPDGITAIDLTLKNQEISGGNPAYTVSYYFTPLDAINATNPLAIPYTNQTPNMQTVYVRVEDANTGCFDTTSLELVVEQAPVAFTPAALEYCDPDSDGFGEFMLSDTEAEITAGAPGLTVTYHETMADAMNNVNALSSPYNNIVANMQTIYVRVESSTIATDCASFVELVLIVNPTPQITDPTALEVCDDNADGFATFNLPSKDAEILNLLDTDPTNDLDPTQYTVTYYITPGDAMAGTNPIATPNAYVNTSNPQIVHVRVEDTANDCFTNTTLELIVNPLPVLVQPDPLALCDVNNPGDEVEAFTLEDANAQILNGQTGITLTYFDTQAGADTNDSAAQIFSPYTNTVNPQTVYVRAENDNTGCVSTITLDLRVNPLPSPVAMPAAIEECDDDNDGFASFDLDAQSAIITNGEPDITISYYETQDDAMNMVNPLVSPYNNIVANMQTIYVLAENDNTGCFTIVEMPLIVQPAPVVPLDIEDYIICDDDDDGFNQFDFDAVITPQIFTAGQTVADFTLTYHTTQANADSGNNPIINTSNYTNNSNPQTIYIRLESNTNGCVTTGEFIIRVEFPPVLDPNYDNELAQCDDLDANYMEANDGFTSFDLTVEDSEIVNGNNSWVVTYYETMADAQGDVNAIADPTNYTNTMNGPQTLYVRVTDNDTGCFSFTTVTLRVLPNPSPTPDPEDLIVCDDTNAGDLIEVFDLTQNEIAIINGELNVTASYYTSQDDAITGNNAIADPTMHTNEDPNNPGTGITPQTIYVRLTNGDDNTGLNGTGCYSLVSFDVIVNPLPTVTPVDDYIICELFNDGMADFDLDGTMTAAILNGQDPSIFTVSYHETQAEADAAINGLNSPYTNITNPQTIYVNITNTITGCDVATLNFNIEVQEAAQANPDGVAIVYEQCDDNMEFDGDPSNDTVQFNLETQNPFVLDGQDANNYTVSYYENQADADAGTNPLPFLYENTSNPQVIIVRVDNDTMIVTPISLDLSSLTTGLDVDSDGNIDTIDTNGDGVFDIVDINGDGIAEGFDSDADGIIDYIDLDGDGNGDLVDLNNDGVVDNGQDSSICYETAEVTLQVNPLPAFDLDDSYLLCINTNGTEVVNSPLVDTGLDASLYSFEWSYEGNVMAGETGPSIMPTEGGNYSVIVTDTSTSANTMCMSSDSTVVDVSEPPVISYELLTAAFADQHDVAVTASGSTATSIAVYEFSLNGGAWQLGTANADGSYSHTFTNIPAGGIVVTARDVNGCGEVSEEIMVLDYPVYFTPNGDGYNETWNIYSISNYPDAKIYIFDRFGKLLKQISPLGDGWNGTYNGNPMPTSDYWFTVEYTDTATNTKKHFRAHFTLKR